MIFEAHIYRQSHMGFFCGQQDEVYRNVFRIPCPQEVIRDLQSTYWMGGEL